MQPPLPGPPKALTMGLEILKVLLTGLIIAVVSFVFGAFDASRKATPDLERQLALQAQQMTMLTKAQENLQVTLAQMHAQESKATLLEYRIKRLEDESTAALARAEAQYRELSMQISNVQQSLTRNTRP